MSAGSQLNSNVIEDNAAGIRNGMLALNSFALTLIRVPAALWRLGTLSAPRTLRTGGLIPDPAVFLVLSALCVAFVARADRRIATIPGILANLSGQDLASHVGRAVVSFFLVYAVAAIASVVLARVTGIDRSRANEGLVYAAGCGGLAISLEAILRNTSAMLITLIEPVPVRLLYQIDDGLSYSSYVYMFFVSAVLARAAIHDTSKVLSANQRRFALMLCVLFVPGTVAISCFALQQGSKLLDLYQDGRARHEFAGNVVHEGRLVRCTLSNDVQCAFYVESSTPVLVAPDARIRVIAPDVGPAYFEFPNSRERLPGILARADAESLAGMAPLDGIDLFVVHARLTDVCRLMRIADARGPVTKATAIGPFAWEIEASVAHTRPSIVFDYSEDVHYAVRRLGRTPTATMRILVYGIESALVRSTRVGSRCPVVAAVGGA